jgi:hypothetical protein
MCAFGFHGRLRVVRRITNSVTEFECDRCNHRILRTGAVPSHGD